MALFERERTSVEVVMMYALSFWAKVSEIHQSFLVIRIRIMRNVYLKILNIEALKTPSIIILRLVSLYVDYSIRI